MTSDTSREAQKGTVAWGDARVSAKDGFPMPPYGILKSSLSLVVTGILPSGRGHD